MRVAQQGSFRREWDSSKRLTVTGWQCRVSGVILIICCRFTNAVSRKKEGSHVSGASKRAALSFFFFFQMEMGTVQNETYAKPIMLEHR